MHVVFLISVLAQAGPSSDFSPPPLVEAPPPEAVNTVPPSTLTPPPPPQTPSPGTVSPPPPRASSGRRSARLVDTRFDQPSTGEQLAGRAVMAPVLGAVGAGAAGFVGLLVGALIGNPTLGGLLVFGLFGAAIGAAVGLAFGVALGASLFSSDFKQLFGKSIGWAFLVTGLVVVIGIISVAALTVLAGVVFTVSSVLLAASVPFVVEWRRLADAPRAPEAALTLARF